MVDQLIFGQTELPEQEPPAQTGAGPVMTFPGPKDKRYHIETLMAYLTNIERLATHIQTIEDWQLASVDLLDNTRAALVLVKCM